jgi:glycine cleavage system H protein
MPDPFRGRIPRDLLYDTQYDMWVRPPDERGIVRVGATAFGVFLAGEVIMFTGKPRGARIDAGKGLGTVETGKTILAAHSPVALEDYYCNEEAEGLPELLNRDPYGRGWLGEGVASRWAEDSARLVNAESYIGHVRSVDPKAFIEEGP